MASDPLPGRDSCCAVVVTYHPDERLPERMALIARQVARVYVVDNASGDAERGMLAGIARTDPSIELVLVDTNEGVGAALNRGFARARAGGFAWVVTFDQDSVVEPRLVDELAAIYREHPQRDRVKLLGSNYVFASEDPGGRTARGSARWRDASTAITSGAMVSASGYERVGPFRADYFIDSIDEEFCLRLRRAGMKVVCSTEPLMRHALGSARRFWTPWGGMALSYHAPFRRFYMMRNRILTMKQYWYREPAWTLARLWSTTAEFIAISLLEPQRRAKVRAMLRGMWHGILGRSGKMEGA